MKHFEHKESFGLENGIILPGIRIAYHTYGELNADRSNVVWVCHALTANSDAADWWPGVIGGNGFVDPQKYFIVCANIIGSCYGSSGPLSVNPATKQIYYSDFPTVTIRDIVNAHILLRKHLGLEKIHLLMGGSMGGYQVLEWAFMEKDVVENIFLIATSATETAWGIAIHTAQRLAIEADYTWRAHHAEAGQQGLKAARAIGMISYRNYGILVDKQTDPDVEKLDDFKASSYIQYQGDKLAKRFNTYSYWLLTKAMDSHHPGRGRGGKSETILHAIKQRAMIIGISSDILCPLREQKFLAQHLPSSTFLEIDSPFGHDGFITESEKISSALANWMR